MDSSNRDLRRPQANTTPVFSSASRSVYRSLTAAPAAAPFSVYRDPASGLERSSKLLGPQTKGPGDVVWSEQKHQKSQNGELLPCPIPLIVAHAPHQSLFVESNPVAKVVSAVHELFQQHDVDSAYNADKFKWKCSCYASESETRFVARLFSVPDKAGFFVLDFQRRSGDAFHFQSLYKAMHFRLLKTGFVVCNDAKTEQMRMEEPVMRTFKPLPLPSDLVVAVDDDCEPIDFTPIIRMCNSQFIDVQREGLAALASQLSEADAGSQESALPIIGRLAELVSLSRDSQVRRLAATALARLSLIPQSHGALSEKGLVSMLVKLTVSAEEIIETRRQACQTLANIPRKALDDSAVGTLKSAQSCADSRLAQLIQSVLA